MSAEGIRECLKGTQFITAVFGSSLGDKDIFVLCPTGEFSSTAPAIKDFLQLTDNLRALNGTRLITKHEHRALVPDDESCCHLLFYPTKRHLSMLELPSFVASVWENGSFSGPRTSLQDIAQNYLSHTPVPLSFDVFSYHIARYDDIAITSLFYSLARNPILPPKAICHRLSYAFRFMVCECVHRSDSTSVGLRTSWSHILEALRGLPGVPAVVVMFLSDAAQHSYRLDFEAAASVSRAYFSLRDTWVGQLRRPEV